MDGVCSWNNCTNKKAATGKWCPTHIYRKRNRLDMDKPTRLQMRAIGGFKICSTCWEKQAVDNFSTSRKAHDGFKGQCKDCVALGQREYGKRASQATKDKVNAKARARYLEKRQYVISLKDMRPCVDCEVSYLYYVMQFDHVIGTKVANINRLISSSASMAKLKEEIDKCELVCGNCHAKRTWQRSQSILV